MTRRSSRANAVRANADPATSIDQREMAQQAFIQRLVNDLLRLRQSVREDGSGSLKDAAAHEALSLGGMLFQLLAGWGRDHVIGRSLESVPAAPYAKGTTAQRSLGKVRPWDNQALEERGADYEFDDPAANQRIITALMYELHDVLRGKLAFQLHEAFEALQFGDVTDLVAPAKSYRKGKSHELWNLRLRAVQHVEFLRGTGLKKFEAQDAVAEAYGLGDSISLGGRKILEQWDRRLRKLFEPFTVRDTLLAARHHGAWSEQLKAEGKRDEFDEDRLQYLENQYGTVAMKRDGKRFRIAKANSSNV